jgi:hypothetical protein
MIKYGVKEDDNIKVIISSDNQYKSIFNKDTGFFARWGETKDDDPQCGPPEIADIEVTTICEGPGGIICDCCYKSNTSKGRNMSLDTFKKLFAKLPKTVTQIAFGADANATSNPELFDIMQHSKDHGVVPNITVADIDTNTAKILASICGAVAVSRYDDRDLCYNSVRNLLDAGMTQVNIHQLLSEETFDNALRVRWDFKEDPCLKGLNAIVFLSLKQKGRGKQLTRLADDKFKFLIENSFKCKVPIGFDSCTYHKFMEVVKNRDDSKHIDMLSEPCESTCFSSYINVDGQFFPCSFTEGEFSWREGLDVVNCNDFMKDIWHHERTENFRKILIDSERRCPMFRV